MNAPLIEATNCPPDGGGVRIQQVDHTFAWIVATGVLGIADGAPAGSTSDSVLPAQSWGWIPDADYAALLASGQIFAQAESPAFDAAASVHYALPATTGVTAGIPGAFIPATAVPPNLAALQALGALGETTAWTVGQNVVLGDSTLAHWGGAAWIVGAAS